MENSASGQIQQEANSSIKNENTEIPEKSRTSSGNENQNEQLVIDITTVLKTSEIPVSDECRIYKVPNDLRKLNEEAYTPCVISIGPYHHNNKNFQTMEKHKERYFKSFIQRAEINLENLVSTIKEMEDSIRRCYVDGTVQLEGNDFVTMIMLDATFILELFLKNSSGNWTRDDHMFVEAYRYGKVKHDLLLLENQLPFFVINKLYQLACPSPSNSPSLIRLTFDYFGYFNIHNRAPEGEIKHFTDLLRFFELPPPQKLPMRDGRVVFPKYSATQLRDAGVKFKVVPNKCVLDLSFKKGVLKIPLLELDDSTEAYVRNIMALEHCNYSDSCFITDFYLILDRLIITDKDVNLLCDYGIIRNYQGDSNASNAAAFMTKNLNKGVLTINMNSDLCCLCEELNAFYENPWHRLKAKLRRQYWKAVSTSAIILALLTLLQTVCSIIQIVPIVKSL